jgi:hypothetical protein
MADTDPTYEKAKRCYRCEVPGELMSKSRQQRPRRGMCTIEIYKCQNNRCRGFERTWPVQVNDDGSIPVRPKATPNNKEFPMPKGLITLGESYTEHVLREIRQGESGPS